jgi:hypothetical protein
VTAHARREDVPDGVAAALRREPWARERRHGRRAGFYDVEVTTHAGVPVAAVHCVAHRVGSP